MREYSGAGATQLGGTFVSRRALRRVMSIARAAREYWLRRAAEVRKTIEETTDPKLRQTLEKLAAEYDTLAERGATAPDMSARETPEKKEEKKPDEPE